MPATAAITAGTQTVNGIINQAFAEHNRKRNYYWNEKAADSADARQRAQYKDLYSPQAMLDQYAAAGLSPSMMMSGGQSAVGGTPQGAQGGISGPYPTADLLNPNTIADVALKKAQIRNLDEDTTTKELENEIKNLQNSKYKSEWDFMQLFNNKAFWKNNTPISIYDIAETAKDYKEFKDALYKNLNDNAWTYLNVPHGDEMLRSVYKGVKDFSNEISVLENSEENAKFLLKITQTLNNAEFINANYKAQLGQLKQIAESTELTIQQKEAFNNLINKMGDGTMSDIVIVLLMMLGNFAHANLNFGVSQVNSIKK